MRFILGIACLILVTHFHVSFAQAVQQKPSIDRQPFISVMSQQQLQLSEVYISDSILEPDWIEIYNPTAKTMTVNSWRVRNSEQVEIGIQAVELKPYAYTVIYLSKEFLARSGGSFTVVDPTGTLLQYLSLTYPAINSELSWALVDNNWCLAQSSPNGSAQACETATPKPVDRNTQASTQFHAKKAMIANAQFQVSDQTPVDASVAGLMDTNVIAVALQQQQSYAKVAMVVGITMILLGILPILALLHRGPRIEFPDHTTTRLS